MNQIKGQNKMDFVGDSQYNLCIDNSTEETEHLSAFYKLVKNENGYWQHDDCNSFYSYNIDFNDNRWKHKLKEAAEKAFKLLC